uniref:SLC41A/MgtE integral membrane domain-containing protein n=1 Tax=Parascaris univalens TaxID=6257 RepID=A0A915CJ69_PARUN
MQSSPKRCGKWRLNSISSHSAIAPIESSVLSRKEIVNKETSLSFFFEANLDEMATRHQQIHIVCSNLAVIQAQSIIVSLLASIAVIVLYTAETGKWQSENSILLCLTSVATASITSLLLGMIMFGMVILAMRIGVNPDNITTPIAASLGDITALIIMICVGTLLLHVQHQFEAECVVLGVWLMAPFLFIWIASKDKSAVNILKNGWYPIFTAMLISSSAGRILKTTVSIFPAVAAFQPVVNGAGGNLVAIQASRISTELHKFGNFGILPDNSLSHFINPLRSFFAKGDCVTLSMPTYGTCNVAMQN